MSQERGPGLLDIVIAGAGVVGLAAALALRRKLGFELKLGIVGTEPGKSSSGRAYAIAPDVRRFLEMIEVWEDVAGAAQPVTEMVITDSRNSDPVRPELLRLRDDDDDAEPLAHIVEEGRLLNALWRRFLASKVAFVRGSVIKLDAGSSLGRARISASTTTGDDLACRLLVAADGAASTCRDLAGIRIVAAGYGQSAIVATVGHQRDHGGRAMQHFLPSGPFARLPLSGRQCSIVWTMPSERARRRLALPAPDFLREVEVPFGLDLGELELASTPAAFPLRVQLARSFVADRLALIGDAAHVVHPLAGQGLNLGLRDAEALADVVSRAAILGLDVGADGTLGDYERQRRHAAFGMAATTDALNRLFSNDVAPIRLMRSLGLGIVERSPLIKRQILAGAAR
jgi:2-octaprenyl-6-methoxyphenol hydroxylase